MNIIGKIFVFAVFVMSLVFMSFAVAIYSSHTNWEREVNRKPEEVKGAERPGLKYQLEQAENDRKKLKQEIEDRLTDAGVLQGGDEIRYLQRIKEKQ